jgi:hypothetical protein
VWCSWRCVALTAGRLGARVKQRQQRRRTKQVVHRYPVIDYDCVAVILYSCSASAGRRSRGRPRREARSWLGSRGEGEHSRVARLGS